MKTKLKTKYVCNSCGSESLKWMGKCPACNEWNTLVEEIAYSGSNRLSNFSDIKPSSPIALTSIVEQKEPRISTKISELDRVLGGGLVPGALILIGGEPGIGKSTLLLQTANTIAMQGRKVLYVTGEESQSQIKGRALRLGVASDNLLVLAEVNLDVITSNIKQLRPEVVIIDSIQIIFKPEIPSSPGTVVQVRECSNELMMLAKQNNVSIFVVGHVTKDGSIAGPRVLEHIVDTVLYFEGDRDHSFRILRAVKNRFGSTNEIAIFEMKQKGLMEVTDPSGMFLDEENTGVSGVVVTPAVEGSRPLLVELQALVSSSNGNGIPRRVASFIDGNRVALLIAIFEKTLGIGLGGHDIFVNLVGGMKISEPALDLGVIIAMASSYRNIPVRKGTIVFGEVGLGGEIRPVSYADNRIKEAFRLGFNSVIMPKKSLKTVTIKQEGLQIIGVATLEQALEGVFDL
jgi:DNA repair protein RadA/Sms